ncbi:hypothetical protein [Sphingomicrobium nitratireducens]|uniref:hypothetical protein n=1 Tax=Sphingomicrobium nitratireducens TaxID=2964666 RepID=UPI002240A924|nr:hypothetical protein [Sphingomicrobium nitratireducens]
MFFLSALLAAMSPAAPSTVVVATLAVSYREDSARENDTESAKRQKSERQPRKKSDSYCRSDGLSVRCGAVGTTISPME